MENVTNKENNFLNNNIDFCLTFYTNHLLASKRQQNIMLVHIFMYDINILKSQMGGYMKLYVFIVFLFMKPFSFMSLNICN